jgi:hypothetical protein
MPEKNHSKIRKKSGVTPLKMNFLWGKTRKNGFSIVTAMLRVVKNPEKPRIICSPVNGRSPEHFFTFIIT